MRVRVLIDGQGPGFVVSVGDGGSRVSWLSMVAVQRFQRARPAGRVRAIEPGGKAWGPRMVQRVAKVQIAEEGESKSGKTETKALTLLLTNRELAELSTLTPADARAVLGISEPGDFLEANAPAASNSSSASPSAPAGAAVWKRVETVASIAMDASSSAGCQRLVDLGPNETIRDCLAEGDCVHVYLCHPSDIVAGSGRVASVFHTDGFDRSLRAEQQRDTRRAEGDLAIAAASAAREASLGKRSAVARRLFDIHMSTTDPGAQQLMFDSDWILVRHAKAITPDEEMKQVELATQQHYVAVRDVFRFYSNLFGTGTTVGGSFAMDQNEFMTIVLGSKFELHGVNPALIFALVCKGEKTILSDPAIRMGRAQFLDGLLCLAGEVNGYVVARLYGRGASPEPVITAEAVDTILARIVQPAALDALTSTKVKKLLQEPQVVDVIFPFLDHILTFFEAFADGEDDPEAEAIEEVELRRAAGETVADAKGAPSMSIDAWFNCLEAIQLLDRDFGKAQGPGQRKAQLFQGIDEDVLTTKEASMGFFLAQSEDEGTGGDVAGIAELDSKEFIEALAHACFAKWEDPDVPLHRKLLDLFDLIRKYQEAACEEKAMASATTTAHGEVPLFAFDGATSALHDRDRVRAEIAQRRQNRIQEYLLAQKADSDATSS